MNFAVPIVIIFLRGFSHTMRTGPRVQTADQKPSVLCRRQAQGSRVQVSIAQIIPVRAGLGIITRENHEAKVPLAGFTIG